MHDERKGAQGVNRVCTMNVRAHRVSIGCIQGECIGVQGVLRMPSGYVGEGTHAHGIAHDQQE